jgi:hypothetical protein
MKHGDTSLHHPVQEHHQQRATGDICASRKGIREIGIRGPDCSDHILEISTALYCGDCSPLNISLAIECTDHQSDEGTNEDCGNATPHTEGDAGNNWERNVVHSSDSTSISKGKQSDIRSKTDDKTANEETEETDGDRLTSSEPDTHDC